jgi:hypothetical protein
MKVSELIYKLKNLPQDAQVNILADNNGPDSHNLYSNFQYCNMNEDHIDFDNKKNIVNIGG